MIEQIRIKKGFTLVERKRTVPFIDASSYLTSHRMRHVTRAEEQNFGVEVTSHAVRCPYCGKEVFAYNREEPLPSREDIAEWCDLQLTMFVREVKAPLEFQTPFTDRKQFFCPRCKNSSRLDDGEISLLLETEKNRISLSRPVEDLEQLLTIPWLKRVELCGNETLSEKITFDFESGNACLSLENEDGIALVSRFLTERTGNAELGFFGALLSEHRVVKRKVKKAFQSLCQNEIPFSLNELDFTQFLLLTKFRDFPRDFYDAIPWDHDTGWMMKDFHFPASFLQSPEQAFKLMQETGLVKAKSVKRIFAQKSGLFFYLPECKILWDLFEDLNLFCALLRSDNIFFILASLHQYPALVTFYQDYKQLRGTRSLLKILKKNVVAINHRGIAYAALSPAAKEKVQRMIKEDRDCASLSYVRAPSIMFSYPTLPLPVEGKEVAIDGFTFKWLKNTADCHRAGIELDNCLVDWNGTKNPVAIVLKGREYVAAIEVNRKEVIQFLGRSNRPIDQEEPIYQAFEKWVRLFDFQKDEMNTDDLPF